MTADDGELETVFRDTQARIQDDINHFGGSLPERTALVWDGFIAALLEYGLVSVEAHGKLSDMLPKIPDNPVVALFLGR